MRVGQRKPLKRIISKRASILAIFVALFLLLSFREDVFGGPLLFEDDFHDLSHWNKLAGTELKRDPTEGQVVVLDAGRLLARGIWRNIDLRHARGRYLVVVTHVKGETLKAGGASYKKGKVMLTFSGEGGKKIRRSETFVGSFDWRYSVLESKIPQGANKVVLSLRNESSGGKIIFSHVKVYLCEKEEIAAFDYPLGWPSLIRENELRPRVTVRMDRAVWVPLAKDLYGFNNLSRQNLQRVGMEDLLQLPAVNTLQVRVLRFPAGIHANHYRWKTDSFDPADLKQFPLYDTADRRKKYGRFKSHPGSYGFSELANWAKKTNTGVSLVLNLTTLKDAEETAGFVLHAEQMGLDVRYVELGNELFLKAQGGEVIRGPQDFIGKAAPVIKKLRVLKGVKIGVPITYYPSEWNKAILSSGLDFDACLVHIYLKDVSSGATVGGDQVMFDFAKEKVPEIFSHLKQEFPGKSFWITEWNFADLPLRRHTNSLPGVIYAVEMLISMIREPGVEMACYHSLYALGTENQGIVNIKDLKPLEQSVVLKYPYFFWEMIGPLFRQCSETAPLTPVSLNDASQVYAASHARIQAFKSGTGATYLIIVNDSASTVHIALTDHDQPVVAQWQALSSDGPIGGIWARPGAPTPVQEGVFRGFLEVKPLSIYKVGPIYEVARNK